jgi:beta-lactamase class A
MKNLLGEASKKKRVIYLRYGTAAVILFIGFFLWGRETASTKEATASNVSFLREPTSYQFISPLLSVSVGDKTQFPELKNFTDKLSATINDYITNNNATDISLYFQDFTNGHWTGVNENEGYNPASLLKVPIMMATLKQADANPLFLSQETIYEPPPADLQQYGFDGLIPGNTYTIDYLLSAMIQESDNGAKDTLGSFINAETLEQTFTYLNLPPLSLATSYTISPRQYGRFFRILYNTTYLSQENSNKALALLSKTQFNDGLIAGIASGTVVSHKFGQYAESVNGVPENPELHDCGIVYYPSNPYFVCIMTKGTTLSSLEKVIADLSKITYQEVKNNYP